MNELKVYLAGGFHRDWHTYVIRRCDDEAPGVFIFLNPTVSWDRKVEMKKSEEEKEEEDRKKTQSVWWPPDKFCIRKADIVFIYFEDYRCPGGLRGTGDVFEAGMCYALDKFTIVVNEVEHRYFRSISRVFTNFKTLEEGVSHLIKCAWVGGML